MWNLIVLSVPDHCLSFYFIRKKNADLRKVDSLENVEKRKQKKKKKKKKEKINQG